MTNRDKPKEPLPDEARRLLIDVSGWLSECACGACAFSYEEANTYCEEIMRDVCNGKKLDRVYILRRHRSGQDRTSRVLSQPGTND